MIAVDTAQGTLLKNSDIKRNVAMQKPYAEWVKKGIVTLPSEKVRRVSRQRLSLKNCQHIRKLSVI